MKVQKLRLDESLFDDDADFVGTTSSAVLDDISWSNTFDDDFGGVDYEKIARLSEVPTGPKEGEESGIADQLISLINDEWEAIRGYNSFAELIRANMGIREDANLNKMLAVIDDVRNEENKHVGQLQELLKLISPNAHSIEDGATEGREQLNFVDGKLQVQEMYPGNSQQTTNEIDTNCTLSDVDDEW